MGANFNLSVKTFTPRTQKCIITGVYVELALPNLSFLCPILSPPATKPAYSLHFANTNTTDTTNDPFHTSFLPRLPSAALVSVVGL